MARSVLHPMAVSRYPPNVLALLRVPEDRGRVAGDKISAQRSKLAWLPGVAAAMAFMACNGMVLLVGLLSMLGLTLVVNPHIQAATVSVFSLLTLMLVFSGYRLYRRAGPLVLALLGAVLVVGTMYVSFNKIVESTGLVLLVSAAVWNWRLPGQAAEGLCRSIDEGSRLNRSIRGPGFNLEEVAMDRAELSVDPGVLREEVKKKYRDVARNPHGEYHFHTGRLLARRWVCLGVGRSNARCGCGVLCRCGESVLAPQACAGREGGRRWVGRRLRHFRRRGTGRFHGSCGGRGHAL